MGRSLRWLSLLVGGIVAAVLVAPPARANEPSLGPGDTGKAVRRLQVRVAGWYPRSKRQVHFAIDGVYGSKTARAVARLQEHYGLAADGVAGPATLRLLDRLADDNGSTAHFNWKEFHQNRNPACSARANAYAGTFAGGKVSARRTKRYVRRLMWRLEALRAKGKGGIGVNSGFRSVPYNDCIGGARASQHLYGTAADNRMADVSNRRERKLARRTQFHGIACYASLSHNHLDLRLDNRDLPSSRFWWWPERDRKGRDLDENGRPCWGQRRKRGSRIAAADGALVPSPAEVRAFAEAGEPADLGRAD